MHNIEQCILGEGSGCVEWAWSSSSTTTTTTITTSRRHAQGEGMAMVRGIGMRTNWLR